MQKLNTLKHAWFILALCFVLPQQASAQSKTIRLNSSYTESHSAQVITDKSDEIKIRFTLNEVTLEEVQTNEGKAYLVSTQNAPQILRKGFPDLLYLSSSVIIPNRGSQVLSVTAGEYQEFPGIDIAPSKGNLYRNVNPEDVPFVKGEVYNQDSFFPEQLASLRQPYLIRDLRGQSIVVNPVQYNPVTRTLRVYKEIIVTVSFNNTKGVNEIEASAPQKTMNSEYMNIYKSLFLNFNSSKYTPLSDEGDLLIICYDDFMDAMKPFVSWKRSMGWKAEIVAKSAAGTSSAAIKNYITEYYNNPEKNLAYVLLVGDGPQIPSMVTPSGDSDNAYGYLLGEDSYSEVFVGRFSAQTVAHVETQVQRMIDYERDMTTEDTWLNIGLGVSRNEGEGVGHNGEADYQHIDFIRDTLLNYTYTVVHREYDGGVPGLVNTNAAAISGKINDGVSIINYCNHGSQNGWSVGDYNSSHVSALTNIGKLPFIWAVACVNGDFVDGTCFAETWLRATSQGEPTGAVGTMMSTINQAWQPPMTGQDEMVTILSESYENNIKRTFAGLSINGSMKMLDVHGASGKETYDTWTVFGDPTLMVRTDTPKEMIISHPANIFIGATYVDISCDTDNAKVAISYTDENDDVQILSVASVLDGSASLQFPEPISGIMDFTVVVTAYNCVTYIGTISSVPADRPYIVLNSYSTSASPDFNTEVGLNVSLKNVSDAPFNAAAISAELSTNCEFISITDDVAEAESIDAGQEASIDNAFTFSISDTIPDQERMVFTLSFTYEYDGSEYESSQNIVIKANSPDLKVVDLDVDDDGAGIPGILDPGETANAVITISNSGHSSVSGVIVSINSDSEFITINDTEPSPVDMLGIGESTEVTFSITADTETPLETPVDFIITVEYGNNTKTFISQLIVGYIPEYKIGDSEEVSACIGKFYDTGGKNGPYEDGENIVMTFKPSSENGTLLFNFTSFDVEEGYDYLYVYDGESTASSQFEGSPFSGKTVPGPFMGTSESGALTFKFVSDNYVSSNGWAAEFACIDLSVPPQCASNPVPADGGELLLTPAKLSWDFALGALSYDIYIGSNSLPEAPTANVSTNYYTFDLEENTDYVWKVVPKNNAGAAQDCPTWTFETNELASIITMKNGSETTSNSYFYDSGGESNSYNNSENLKLTIYPVDEWAKVKVVFEEFGLEESYDYLKIYNGSTTTSGLIGSYTGSSLPTSVTSTNKNGALTFHFTSDYMVNDKGWKAYLSNELVNQNVTFTVKSGSGSPLEGVEISTSKGDLVTNAEGIASIELPQNCEFTYELTKEGFHLVEGTFFLGPEPKTVQLVMYTLSDEVDPSENLNVYPNPFTDKLYINGGTELVRGSLINSIGQKIRDFEITNNNFNITTTELPKGVYFLMLNSRSGKIDVIKLVKK